MILGRKMQMSSIKVVSERDFKPQLSKSSVMVGNLKDAFDADIQTNVHSVSVSLFKTFPLRTS